MDVNARIYVADLNPIFDRIFSCIRFLEDF